MIACGMRRSRLAGLLFTVMFALSNTQCELDECPDVPAPADMSTIPGLPGASFFYRQGLVLEKLHMFLGASRSLQTAVRLLEEGRGTASGEDSKEASLLELIHNASWEIRVREMAREVGLGAASSLQIDIDDCKGPLPVQWRLGDDLSLLSLNLCCAGHVSASDTCFDFGDVDAFPCAGDDEMPEEGRRLLRRIEIIQARGSGISCAQYVHGLLEGAENEYRDMLHQRKAETSAKLKAKERPARYMPDALRAAYLDQVSAVAQYNYFDDSYPDNYKHFPRPYLDAMARMIRARSQGINYADVDAILYRLLDSDVAIGQCDHMVRGHEMRGALDIEGIQCKMGQDCCGRDREDRSKGLRGWLHDASVVVVGSVVPWYEVMALESGALFTLTLEYNHVSYAHERMYSDLPERYWSKRRQADLAELEVHRPTSGLSIMHDADELARGQHSKVETIGGEEAETGAGGQKGARLHASSRALPGGWGKRFDLGMSISSIEHAGLGRYGDPLDPHADVRAMRELEQIIRDDGLLVLALPVGRDTVRWNSDRVYGRRRLTLLIERWVVEGIYGMVSPMLLDLPVEPTKSVAQPVFLLRNRRPRSAANFSDPGDAVWARVGP